MASQKSLTCTLTGCQAVVLSLFIYLFPLNNIGEVYMMMIGHLPYGGWALQITPLYLKAFKDIFLFISMLITIVYILKNQNIIFKIQKYLFLVNIFIVFLVLFAIGSFFILPPKVVLFGIRGYYVILLIYTGFVFYNIDVYRFIYKPLMVIFIVHILLQFVQLLQGYSYKVFLEYRFPGIFIDPSTAGAFALLVLAYSIFYKNRFFQIFAIGSLILSNSTMGLLILIGYLMLVFRNMFYPKKIWYPIFLLLMFGILYFIFMNLPLISLRNGGALQSGLSRIDILLNLYFHYHHWILGNGLGLATSEAVISKIHGSMIADNTYIGLIVNMGLIPMATILVLFLRSFKYYNNVLLFFILFGYSFTVVIFELNPIVQILMFLLGKDIRVYIEKQHECN